MNAKSRMENLASSPIFDEIKVSSSMFNSTFFVHVYKDFNGEVDTLLKEGL